MQDISENIDDFFKLYFKAYLALKEENRLKIEGLGRISYPEMDFVFVFKFVRIELDHLKSLDLSILDKELRNIFESGKKTVSALIKFKKSIVPAHLIFKNNFTEFNGEAKSINNRFEKTKSNKSMNTVKAEKFTFELAELKKKDRDNTEKQKEINSNLANALQNIQDARDSLIEIEQEKKEFEKKYLPIFLSSYKENSDKIVHGLIKQMAVFSFTANREIWINASRSRKIMSFFNSIDGADNMNIQKYMEYHLNHQTSSDNKGEKAIIFRKKLINSINIMKVFVQKTKK